MEKQRIQINGLDIPFYHCHTLIIGSGAAALNCAFHLHNNGITDLLIVTEKLGGGVSNNSGSDKQTYYKLSVFGEAKDSVYEMARTLFTGGAMHGDIALVEAALSIQEFYHLVQIGVPFPHNVFGGYIGYKTDHDPRERATSAGPWTSNQMVQKLLNQIRLQQIPLLDHLEVIFLLTISDNDIAKVVGALALDKTKLAEGVAALVLIQAENIVMGTGGPGGLYETSVYPIGHLGSTGVALEAGAAGVNLSEWQYGLASLKFRWNVSGTYQQVIPSYVSTDNDGSNPRQFLNQYFPTMGKLATAIFLKGYQWPFDPRKINNYGSSLIDILVYQETVVKGRRVWLDFRQNPQPGEGLKEFDFSALAPEAHQYLKKSDALLEKPIDRLRRMNPLAIELYLQHGIDLGQEPLEIAVCAQHHNGGLKANIWWESNLGHLFPIGEASGSHGVYRPGGSALNSGQVGGYRAAEYIANCYSTYTYQQEQFLEFIRPQLTVRSTMVTEVLKKVSGTGQNLASFRMELQQRMTRVAAHIRKMSTVKAAIIEAEAQWKRINSGEVGLENMMELIDYFQNRHLCLTQIAVLKSIAAYLEQSGGSRGSYLVIDEQGIPISEKLGKEWRYRPENEELRRFILEYQYRDGVAITQWTPVRAIPEDCFWFENVWQAYLKKEIYNTGGGGSEHV